MDAQQAPDARQGQEAPPAEGGAKPLRPRRRRERWALAALLFPLFFTAVVGTGVYLMFHRQLGFFRPAHATGSRDSAATPLAGAPGRGGA